MVNNSMSNTMLVARRRLVALCKKAIPVRAMWLRVNRIERARIQPDGKNAAPRMLQRESFSYGGLNAQ